MVTGKKKGDQKMKYRVMNEYLDKWTRESVDELIVDDAEIARLAREWDVTVDELMEQVEKIEEG